MYITVSALPINMGGDVALVGLVRVLVGDTADEVVVDKIGDYVFVAGNAVVVIEVVIIMVVVVVCGCCYRCCSC